MKTSAFFIIIFCCFNSLFAKSWHFDSIHIRASVYADGSMHITESRSFSFKGSFSWADYHLSDLENQQIINFTLRDQYAVYAENSSELSGSFYTERVANQFYCKWFYEARNETRTFTLDYTVSNVIKTYEDVAELYWKFIGEANPAWVDTVSIVIHLPEEASFGEVRAWAHGPLWGNVKFTHNHILLTVDDLPQQQYVEGRVVFPPQWVPQSKALDGRMRKKIMDQEEQYTGEANRKRQQAIIDQEKEEENNARAYDLAMPMGIGVIILFIFLYWRYGRGFETNYTQKTDPNIPSDLHPVLLNSIFFNNSVSASTLSTALFYLAQKGILQIEKDESQTKKWYDNADPVIIKLDRDAWQKQQDLLQDFENDLVLFLFSAVSKDEDRLTSKQMKKASSKMQKWFHKWQKIIKSHLKENPYLDRESIRGSIINASVSFVIVVVSVFIITGLGPNGLFAFIPAVISCFLSLVILRYTPETKLLRQKLRALQNYLKTFIPSSYQFQNLHSISDYFLFAIVLGLGKKHTQNILSDIPVEEQAVLFPWFLYAGQAGSAEFASAINSVVSAAATSVSSAAGAGGGMAGAGGAGGGGAAGGAG